MIVLESTPEETANAILDGGLDQAGDDVNRRTLGRDYQMYPRGSRKLGQTADGILHLARCNHHQIRKLVDDDDDLRHLLRFVFILYIFNILDLRIISL